MAHGEICALKCRGGIKNLGTIWEIFAWVFPCVFPGTSLIHLFSTNVLNMYSVPGNSTGQGAGETIMNKSDTCHQGAHSLGGKSNNGHVFRADDCSERGSVDSTFPALDLLSVSLFVSGSIQLKL